MATGDGSITVSCAVPPGATGEQETTGVSGAFEPSSEMLTTKAQTSLIVTTVHGIKMTAKMCRMEAIKQPSGRVASD